ncbi:MAG: ATP-binding cassette domain-containing protein [Candidatus Marinimicrobia bacterium]|nr:ATP-binding cassette domain-containing protein [Candidatus Neomarinimicrobiota bacterium]
MIRFADVSMNYGKVEGLQQISTEFLEKQFTLLLGPTGSGKSTLLRMIYMDLFPSSGTVYVENWSSRNIKARHIQKLRRRVGIIFQDFRLIENLSVFENVALPLIMLGKSRHEIKDRVHAILDEVGLLNRVGHRAENLSGGEQQRTAIARAVVKDPLIVLADEPTGNLDPESAKTIFNLLEKINNLGTAVIMATHNHGLIEGAPHRRLMLDSGKIKSDDAL